MKAWSHPCHHPPYRRLWNRHPVFCSKPARRLRRQAGRQRVKRRVKRLHLPWLGFCPEQLLRLGSGQQPAQKEGLVAPLLAPLSLGLGL